MNLIQIYRIALAEGLTAAEAADKFGCDKKSLPKVGWKYKMPKLITTFEKQTREHLKKMNDQQLASYYNTFSFAKNKNASKKEKQEVEMEIQNRQSNGYMLHVGFIKD